jgi:hypothetical protein
MSGRRARSRKRSAVAGREQLRFAETAAPPHRSDRVDHPARRQPEPRGRLGRAGFATAQLPAVLEQFRSGRPVDRPVDTAASEQRRVGGVDDGVDVLLCDVAPHEAQLRRHLATVPLPPGPSPGRQMTVPIRGRRYLLACPVYPQGRLPRERPVLPRNLAAPSATCASRGGPTGRSRCRPARR